MIYNLVHNLCESLVVNIGGVAGIGKKTPPTPITYLTQWKIVGNSEVHTLPYPDGVVLPNGYKRCNYLASDGAAYIELPYGFEVTDNIYIKCAMSEVVDWGGVIAAKTWETTHNKRFTFGGAVTKNSVHVFTSSFGYVGPADGVLTPQIEADTNTHEWSYSNNTITLDSNSSITYPSFGSGSTDELRLFYGFDIPRKYRIYDYRHTKGNTEYHLVPCLDSNDTPCMYDVINNQAYYNSADSGSFTYELYPQPTEIWSCGEYNATDGKYHILVQPQGGSIADIALDEPLRKVNNVADTIEFPSGTEGKALVTRNLALLSTTKFIAKNMDSQNKICLTTSSFIGANYNQNKDGNILCNKIEKGLSLTNARAYGGECFALQYTNVWVRNGAIAQTVESYQSYFDSLGAIEVVYQLVTPTTELVDAPQIEEAESYTCVISQGGKAVSWSSFETN